MIMGMLFMGIFMMSMLVIKVVMMMMIEGMNDDVLNIIGMLMMPSSASL